MQYPNPKIPNTAFFPGFAQVLDALRNTKRSQAILFLAIVQCVGIMGFLLPQTKDFFKSIVPFHLLGFMVLIIISLYKPQVKDYLVLLLVGFLGYLVEVIGVNTGLIFGDYEYGNALGFKILNTPILIGVNWLILLISSIGMLQNKGIIKKWMLIIASSILLTLLDFIIEPVAIDLGFWSWEGIVVPIQNYFGWFITALLLSSCIVIQDINLKGSLAELVWWLELSFFLVLFLRLILQ